MEFVQKLRKMEVIFLRHKSAYFSAQLADSPRSWVQQANDFLMRNTHIHSPVIVKYERER